MLDHDLGALPHPSPLLLPRISAERILDRMGSSQDPAQLIFRLGGGRQPAPSVRFAALGAVVAECLTFYRSHPSCTARCQSTLAGGFVKSLALWTRRQQPRRSTQSWTNCVGCLSGSTGRVWLWSTGRSNTSIPGTGHARRSSCKRRSYSFSPARTVCLSSSRSEPLRTTATCAECVT